MKALSRLALVVWAAALLPAQQVDKGSQRVTGHPPDPRKSAHSELGDITDKVTAGLPRTDETSASPIPRNNYIDDFIFGKMGRGNIPYAPLSSDEEFLRRVCLDLTGRLPELDRVREFIADPDPDKRAKVIDELTDAKVDPDAIPHPTHPFLDRWTYFFSDLFRNAAPELGVKGRNLFWDYLNTALLLRVPYNQMVTEMLTVTFSRRRFVVSWTSWQRTKS